MAKGPRMLCCELRYYPIDEIAGMQSTPRAMLDLRPRNGLQNLCLYASQYKQKKAILLFRKWVYRFATRCQAQNFLITCWCLAPWRGVHGVRDSY